jgi:hypothetical protein
LLQAYAGYSTLHSFDGYSDKDISDMAKTRPEVRSQYGKYIEANRKLKRRLGREVESKSFKGLLG